MSQDTLVKIRCNCAEECNDGCNKSSIYYTQKNPRIQERLGIKKFCKYCNKHVTHKETK